LKAHVVPAIPRHIPGELSELAPRQPSTTAFGLVGEKLNDHLTDAREIRTELEEYLRGDTFTFANEAKKDVFSAHIIVSE